MQQVAAVGLNVNEDYVIASKRLASQKHFKDITNCDTEIRQFLYTNTRPWLDEGWRVCPTVSYFDVLDGLSQRFDKRDRLVRELSEHWPAIVEESRIALNGEFDPADFPADITDRYSRKVTWMPIPRAGDFRAPEGIDSEDVAKIEADAMAKIEDQFKSRDLWRRIAEELTTEKGSIGDRLRAYGVDQDGKVVNKFHDTLITNIRELVSGLKKLNIEQDENIDNVSTLIDAEICSHEPEELRKDETLRNSVAQKADDILAIVSAFMA